MIWLTWADFVRLVAVSFFAVFKNVLFTLGNGSSIKCYSHWKTNNRIILSAAASIRSGRAAAYVEIKTRIYHEKACYLKITVQCKRQKE